MTQTFFGSLRLWLGIERSTTRASDKWLSGLGAALGIVAVYHLTTWVFPQGFDGTASGLVMVASMGASAVLLFAVPLGALSQPWPVIGGHLLSAIVGVSVQKLLPGHVLAPALAVGAAVAVMAFARCIHPPGGATALSAVIGGQQVHALGYHYLLMPVLVNVVAILAMAVLFNGLFRWRRYPAHLHRLSHPAQPVTPAQRQFDLTQEDFHAAMERLNAYVDITEEQMTELLELAKQHAERVVVHPRQVVVGRCYSNGRLGRAWAVREVVSVPAQDAAQAMLSYRVLAGEGAGQQGQCTLEAFRQWARFEVVAQRNGRWTKAETGQA
ncbi:HPP family protein [Pseudoxanthomonas composti]|uniref:HPP domain-containing protein n=1 Tax=Pseudoxanthomonas composti TaxID=2137479 RepID=A0A4Q1JT03_9GAMM|nr:HPP family protein [Pseudoxanthomonas composti]RXR03441.1 HPP domain-containing protein [Pseudoxanthomonas composti]